MNTKRTENNTPPRASQALRALRTTALALCTTLAACAPGDDVTVEPGEAQTLNLTGKIVPMEAVATRAGTQGEYGIGAVVVIYFADGVTDNPPYTGYALTADGAMTLVDGFSAPTYRDKTQPVYLYAYGLVEETLNTKKSYLPIQAVDTYRDNDSKSLQLEFHIAVARVTLNFTNPGKGTFNPQLLFKQRTDDSGANMWIDPKTVNDGPKLNEDSYTAGIEYGYSNYNHIIIPDVFPGQSFPAGTPIIAYKLKDDAGAETTHNVYCHTDITLEAGYQYTFNVTIDGTSNYIADNPIIAPLFPGNGEDGEHVWGSDGQ